MAKKTVYDDLKKVLEKATTKSLKRIIAEYSIRKRLPEIDKTILKYAEKELKKREKDAAKKIQGGKQGKVKRPSS
jgi:E3 ubiquitin-protein ligase DOA10